MSAPQSDLMGNAITEPIVEDDDFDVEINVVDDRPEEDKRSESQADDFDPEGEIPATARNAKTRIQKPTLPWIASDSGKTSPASTVAAPRGSPASSNRARRAVLG